jgi:hypothetical protein
VSVEENAVIDIISISRETEQAVLTISDHLDWSDTIAHQILLKKKFNAYLAFVESGEILRQTLMLRIDLSYSKWSFEFRQMNRAEPFLTGQQK